MRQKTHPPVQGAKGALTSSLPAGTLPRRKVTEPLRHRQGPKAARRASKRASPKGLPAGKGKSSPDGRSQREALGVFGGGRRALPPTKPSFREGESDTGNEEGLQTEP